MNVVTACCLRVGSEVTDVNIALTYSLFLYLGIFCAYPAAVSLVFFLPFSLVVSIVGV